MWCEHGFPSLVDFWHLLLPTSNRFYGCIRGATNESREGKDTTRCAVTKPSVVVPTYARELAMLHNRGSTIPNQRLGSELRARNPPWGTPPSQAQSELCFNHLFSSCSGLENGVGGVIWGVGGRARSAMLTERGFGLVRKKAAVTRLFRVELLDWGAGEDVE